MELETATQSPQPNGHDAKPAPAQNNAAKSEPQMPATIVANGANDAGDQPQQTAEGASQASELPTAENKVAEKTVATVLGEITWVMTQSRLHKHMLISDLEWMIMPAVLMKQFRIFYFKDRPGGVALWAHLSEEVEKRLEAGHAKLSPQDWRSGDRLWLVELIAPFGHEEAMLEDLKKTAFKGKEFRYQRTLPDSKPDDQASS